MLVYAIIFQVVTMLWFILTHFISMPPLNDLREEAFPSERKANFILVFIQSFSMIGFVFSVRWLMGLGTVYWTLFLAGHLISWWLPYFFGWPKAFLKNAVVDNAKTVHFLPPRKNHPIPDLAHCILGMLALGTCLFCWASLS